MCSYCNPVRFNPFGGISANSILQQMLIKCCSDNSTDIKSILANQEIQDAKLDLLIEQHGEIKTTLADMSAVLILILNELSSSGGGPTCTHISPEVKISEKSPTTISHNMGTSDITVRVFKNKKELTNDVTVTVINDNQISVQKSTKGVHNNAQVIINGVNCEGAPESPTIIPTPM